MRLKFYGIRGSHPTPGPDTVEYGGNTTCFTVDTPEGLKIFDLGSGAVQLGNELVTGQVDADVFLSHQHWDHIQGFPFFKPAYVPGNELRIHGGHQRVERGREQATTIRAKDPGMNYVKGPFMDQQRKDVFPVGLDYLGAEISFTDLEDGQTLGDGTTVTTMYHNQHPGGMFAYRIERNGASIGFTGDYEADKGEEDRRMAEFMRGVDVLIADGAYAPEDYEKKKGFGHSNVLDLCDIAAQAEVGELLVYHPDPDYGDVIVDGLQDLCEGYMENVVQADIPVRYAREGMEREVLPILETLPMAG